MTSEPTTPGAGHTGPGARGVPVVLLHGVGLDRTMWAPVLERLERAGRAAVALDLPGHGAQPPLTTPRTLADLADDVLGRLPAGPVDLVGFSLGALIAQHLARFHPERVRTLACVSSVCRRTPAEREAVLGRLATARDDFAASAEASIERWYPAGTRAAAADVEATARILLANDIDSYLHAYAVFATGDAAIGDELGAIAAPTLAITGALDPGSTPDMSRRLAEAVPDARVVIVPGARHMLPVEAPDAFTDALAAFLDERATPTLSEQGASA